MSTKVCCSCIRTGRCEKCHCKMKGCTNCRNPDCKSKRAPQQDDRTTLLPQNRKEAINKSLWILKELILRCERAAYMNYTLADAYDTKVFGYTIAITLAVGFTTSFLWSTATEYYGMTSDSYLDNLFKIILLLTGAVISFVKVCPQYLLPVLEKKCNSHNEAGAAWQELDIQIRGFLATNIEDKLTPEKLEDFINNLSEKRREICKIAKPTQSMHRYCEDNPEEIVNSKNKLRQAVDKYWDQLV